jgi:hypothetical protein
MYKAIFYRRTETKPMITEIESVKANARKVEELPPPQVPMLVFTSNGEGTGIDMTEWRQYQTDYLAKVKGSQQVILDCGHYVQDYEFLRIAAESKEFISTLAD